MPRQACIRQMSDNQLSHVIKRGILRQEIYHYEEDYRQFIAIMPRFTRKGTRKVYHWCCMPNHYHLLTEFLCCEMFSKVIGMIQQIYVMYYHTKVSNGW